MGLRHLCQTKLPLWFQWLFTTQQPKPSVFQWQERTTSHVLPSGLDDYPRGEFLHSDDKHIDLLSWLAFFASTLSKLRQTLSLAPDLALEKQLDQLLHSLDEHWGEDGFYDL